MQNQKPILQLRGIDKSFSGIKVLDQIELELYPGEVHCLVGENGAGKSTIIKIISGAYTYDAGEYIFAGEKLTNITPSTMLSLGVNTIYQEIDVIPMLSVSENISLGHEPRTNNGNIDRKTMERIASESLQQIGAEDIDINSPMNELKVAHQQMVVIAKALHLKSRVIIFDEPSAVFSAREVDLLYNIVRGLKEKGIAIVYISHHFDEIFEIGDRVTVLKDGKVSAVGKIKEFNHDSLVRAMVGRDIDLSYRDESIGIGDEVLKVEKLSSNNFEDINFAVKAGEIVGIAGLVGSGRTELLQAIIGVDSYSEGRVYLNGKECRMKSPRDALYNQVGILPEDRKEDALVLIRSVEENAAISSVVSESKFGLTPWKKIRKKVHKIINSLSVKYPGMHSEIRFLSGGNQQKIVLSKLLAAECKLMLLDEPTRGVDVGARNEIYEQMQKLRKQEIAMLMVSSDLAEILSQSDRILVMSKGRIAGELTHAEATEEKVLNLALSTTGDSE